MTVAEVIILIIGIILFAVSFILPEKKGSLGAVDRETTEKVAREIVEKEVGRFKMDMEEATEETISDNQDKMERMLDRLTNEKMLAINEYSDTVLEQIHKDHDEAMFLYDMINNKHSQVKNTAAELNQLEKDVRNIALSNEKAMNAVAAAQDAAREAAVVVPQSVSVQSETITETVITEAEVDTASEASVSDETEKTTKNSSGRGKKKEKKAKDSDLDFAPFNPERVEISNGIPVGVTYDSTPVELMFESDSNSMNNNDRIIALHKEGKSNMAIAKELGLGIGEVKLVLDLNKAQGV